MLAEHVKVTQTNPTTPRHLDGDALARPCQHDDPGANPGAGPTSRDLYLYREQTRRLVGPCEAPPPGPPANPTRPPPAPRAPLIPAPAQSTKAVGEMKARAADATH